MHGSMGVASELGQGSAFWVRLPQGVVDGKETANVEISSPILPNPVSGKVLYIEDNVVNATLIKQLFARLLPQIELTIVYTGAAGMQTALKMRPDLILLDMHLPDDDGISILKNLRAAGVKAPIYALTADALVQEQNIALQAGFQLYITKPVNAAELQSIIIRGISEST